MNILLINGSPKGKNSNSLKLANAFIEGLGNIELKQIDVASKNIGSCKGCFCCWNKTPGKCVINDDMSDVIESFLWADIIVWSFPLYYYNVPGLLKNLIDRQLPMSLPFMIERTDGVGSGSHPSRYDMSGKRHVLVSTCGFYSAEKNYDSVKSMFDHFCGKDNYETIFCGQGELFRVKELKTRTDEYLEIVKTAGKEFAQGRISSKTKEHLDQLLYEKEVFEKMADSSWGVSKEGSSPADETLTFTKQMAALYNRNSFKGQNKILEIRYTDCNKAYQIMLTKEGSSVSETCDAKPTTVIETPFTVWTSIAQGEIRGDAALMQGLYKVTGDFDLMMHWGEYFGQTKNSDKASVKDNSKKTKDNKKNPNMIAMLIPWMTFWIATAINNTVGPVIAMFICASIPLVFYKNKMTVYDVISIFAGGMFAGLTSVTRAYDIIYIVSYLCFGLLWLISCFTKEPVCASYVKFNYNGEDALKNPIFMKTNYILAAAWGVLYICISAVTYFLYKYDLRLVSILVSNISPVVMGIFTGWFVNWYPAHVARR